MICYMRSKEASYSSFTTVAHMGGTNQHIEQKLGGWRWAPLCPQRAMKRSPQDRTKSFRTGSLSPSPESRLLGALAYTLAEKLSELLRPSPKNHSGSWRDGCSAVKSLQRTQIQFPAAMPGSPQALATPVPGSPASTSGLLGNALIHTDTYLDIKMTIISFLKTLWCLSKVTPPNNSMAVSGGTVGPHNRECLRVLLYLACIDQTGH